jgi:hypothetical protein
MSARRSIFAHQPPGIAFRHVGQHAPCCRWTGHHRLIDCDHRGRHVRHVRQLGGLRSPGGSGRARTRCSAPVQCMVPSLVLIGILHVASQQCLHDRAGESRHGEERFHQREDELKRGRGVHLERRALAELRSFEQAARDGAGAVRADFDHKPRDYRRLVGPRRDPWRARRGERAASSGHFCKLCRSRGECNAVLASLLSGTHT